jgi:hypothetical protein
MIWLFFYAVAWALFVPFALKYLIKVIEILKK